MVIHAGNRKYLILDPKIWQKPMACVFINTFLLLKFDSYSHEPENCFKFPLISRNTEIGKPSWWNFVSSLQYFIKIREPTPFSYSVCHPPRVQKVQVHSRHCQRNFLENSWKTVEARVWITGGFSGYGPLVCSRGDFEVKSYPGRSFVELRFATVLK